MSYQEGNGLLVDQDAAFTAHAGGHLFRSVAQDPNGHAVPLLTTWALANETNDSWVAHQEKLSECFEGGITGEDDHEFEFLNHPSTCFISDLQKGLRASQEMCFPHAGKAACYKHFQADLVAALGHKYTRAFDELAFCTREDEFNVLWGVVDPVLQRYLDKYPRSLWTKLWGNPSKKTRTSSSVSTSHRACVSMWSLGINIAGPLFVLRSSRA